MTPQETGTRTLTFKKRVFDLDKFERVTLEGKVEYKSVTSLPEAIERIGNDQARLIELLDAALAREAKREAKKNMVTNGNVGNATVVTGFVNTFSQMAPFNVMPETTPEERQAKRQAIYAFIKGIPQIMDGIRSAAVNGLDTEEDDPDQD